MKPLTAQPTEPNQKQTELERILTSPLWSLRLHLQTTLMYKVKSLDSIPSLDDTRDIDLVRSLTDHLDIDIALTERGEHPAGDTDQIDHLFSDEGKDSHIMVYGDLDFIKKKKRLSLIIIC